MIDLDDFDLGEVNVDETNEIALRMNSFEETLAIKQIFTEASRSELSMFVEYDPMPPNYYDAKLCSYFESCLRTKFVGVNCINEVKSNYVKAALRKLDEQL